MKIERIKVTNFNGKNYALEPGKINPMIDKNGAGKTSLLRAILWGLTGEKTDADETEVLIELDPTFIIERLRHDGKNSCKLNGNKVTEKALNAAIEDKIGISLDAVKMASSEAVLETTKPEELLKALIGYVTEELDVEKIISHLTSPTPEIINKVREVFPKAPETFTLDKLDEVYKTIYDERKGLAAIYKQKDAVFKQLAASTIKPVRPLEKVAAELLEIDVAAKTSADAAKRLKEWEKATAQERARKEEMAKIEATVTELKHKGHPASEIKQQEENRQKAEATKLKLASERATIENNISIFERTLKSLDQPVCPISNKLVCTTDKTGIKAELEKSVSDNKKLIENIKIQEASCNETLEAYMVWKKQVDEDAEKYQTKIKLLERHKTLRENPVNIPEKPVIVDVSTLSSKRTALMAEKQNCENYQKMITLEAELKTEKAAGQILNYLVDALKDKGVVKEAIIRDYLVVFEDVMNKRAETFAPGYQISLSVNGGLRVALKTPGNKEAYDSSTLSSGEKLLVRFLMLDMLNQLTGTNLMFIDNIESLDEEALTHLHDLINNEDFKSLYDHVFIAGVNHPDVAEKFAN